VPLLQICHDTVDAVGIQRPVAIVTGMDQLSRQLLSLAKESLEDLSLMDWPVLVMVGGITTVPGQETYDLPVDFEHEIDDTMYAAARFQALRGSLTPGDWARQKQNMPDIGQYRFRVFGNPLKLHVLPVPQLAENLVYEYKTKNRVRKSDGITLAFTYTEDQDVSLVHEELVKKGLKWRLRRAKGLDYTEEFDEYEISRNSRLAQSFAFGSMPVAVRSPWDGAPLTDGYVPEVGFG